MPENHHEIFKNISCDVSKEKCMAGLCGVCPCNEFWDINFSEIDSKNDITWNKWITQNNRPEIKTVTATCREAYKELKDTTDKFRLHCYKKKSI